jgi:hypothetical protein
MALSVDCTDLCPELPAEIDLAAVQESDPLVAAVGLVRPSTPLSSSL